MNFEGLFIFILMISSNFFVPLYPCRFQNAMKDQILLRHIFGFFTVMFFVNLTMPFNTITTLTELFTQSFSLYFFFIILVRNTFYIFMFLLFLLMINYLISIKVKFIKDNTELKDEEKNAQTEQLNQVTKIVNWVFFISSIIGFLIYLGYKKIEYKMQSPLTFNLSFKASQWQRFIWHAHEDFHKPVSLIWNFDFKSEMYKPKPDTEAAIVFSTSAPLNTAKQPLKHTTQPVIDLHFEALDAPQHITEGFEKFRYQMDVFENELQKAFDLGCKSIIFIHGVGNGRLKSELVNRLQQKLHVSFHDASYKEYGAGATQVNLYRNGTYK